MIKRIIALFLVVALTLCGCSQNVPVETNTGKSTVDTPVMVIPTKDKEVLEIPEDELGDPEDYTYEATFDELNDENLLRYVEDNIYAELVTQLDSSDYYVENVSAVFVSKEYLEEVAYNSQANIFFGYTLEEIDNAYGDTKYVFTLSDSGETIVKPLEDCDDTYKQIIKNVAIGSGVILICVTVAMVTSGVGAPAASLIFAASAKTGTIMATSSALLGGVATGVLEGLETGDMNQAVKAGVMAASEGFKWGAIGGAIIGGSSELMALKGAATNLSMNEAAVIQKETGYPTDVISQFHSMDEYKVFKDAGLKAKMVNGQTALVRNDIDLNLVDDLGRTNLTRMQEGLSPLDATGKSFELHHVGQNSDATIAILSQSEHDSEALHGFKAISEIDRKAFAKQRSNFWKTMAKLLESGEI